MRPHEEGSSEGPGKDAWRALSAHSQADLEYMPIPHRIRDMTLAESRDIERFAL